MCPNIDKKVTPNLKQINSTLLLINFTDTQHLGGSVLYKTHDLLGEITPSITNYTKVKDCFNIIQDCIFNDLILSLHDKSDGGLITTLSEMTISSGIGINLCINEQSNFIFI